MADGFYYVLTRGRWARAVHEDEFDRVREMETEGWKVIWDSAVSLEAAYDYAAAFARCIPEDYQDSHGPRPMEKAIPLFRSVSLPELDDIAVRGLVQGKGNMFNEFDPRRFVFFGDRISPALVSQGEELGRQARAALDKEPFFLEFMWIDSQRRVVFREFEAEYEAAKASGNPMRPGLDVPRLEQSMKRGSTWAAGILSKAFVRPVPRLESACAEMKTYDGRMEALRKVYSAVSKEWIEREKAVRGRRPFTSAVIETVPLCHGYHYSKAHGKSGMGDEDEYGFYPGSVMLSDISRIHLVKDGCVIRTVPADGIDAIIEESNEFTESMECGPKPALAV